MTNTQQEHAKRFLELHRRGDPLLMPNAWDLGSAALLASLGFQALATTSSGHAATLGRLDGGVTRDEALAHAAELARGSDVPVSADLENAFADDSAGVAETIGLAVQAGLAGCSVEDYSGGENARIYELEEARERVAAAVDAAHSGPVKLVLTARAENHIRGRDDLADTIARLQAYADAGADVAVRAGDQDPRRHPQGRRIGRPARQRARLPGCPHRLRVGRARGRPDLGRRSIRVRGAGGAA